MRPVPLSLTIKRGAVGPCPITPSSKGSGRTSEKTGEPCAI